ncbi:MAG: hypothetical protein IKV67_10670 [Paludibacteraceae bacterium]|nr:hypothetical protein [Paludibacteraceae bacterium]
MVVPVAGGSSDLYCGFKGGSNARIILDTKGNPKLHPKTQAPLIDNQSKSVDKTVNLMDLINDIGGIINSLIQF